MGAPWRAEISGTTERGYGGERGGGARATRSTAGRAPHPDPGPNWTGQNRSSPRANASCGRPAGPGSAWRLLYSKKKPGRGRASDLRNDYLLVLLVSFFSSALAFTLPFVDLALALPFFAVLLSAFISILVAGLTVSFGAWA